MENSVIKGALEEILKESITYDVIHDTISEVIFEKIDYNLEYMIKSIAEEVIADYTKELIRKKVDEFISSPIKVSDGWGDEKEYDSFERFLKNEIKDKLSSSWDVQRTVKNYVDEKIKNVCNKVSKEIAKTQVDEVIKRLSE